MTASATATLADRCCDCLYTVEGRCHHALSPTPEACHWFRRVARGAFEAAWDADRRALDPAEDFERRY